jgi:hypothetical protein
LNLGPEKWSFLFKMALTVPQAARPGLPAAAWQLFSGIKKGFYAH